MFEKQIDISQEVMSLSQAKGSSEKELWDMPLGDYYATIAAFGKYVEKQNEMMKKKN